MGDAKSGPACLSFNSQLHVEFRGSTVTSDAGLVLPRQLERKLQFPGIAFRPCPETVRAPITQAR
jgi:hypothetical protein